MKTKKTAKQVKITSYKKAYEKLQKEHEELKKERNELQGKYVQLARAANDCTQWASALTASETIRARALEEIYHSRNVIIKHDV